MFLFAQRLLGVFILQEQESYQNTLAFILFLTFWNGYFSPFITEENFAKIWNILGFVLISSILLKYFDLNFYLKWLIVLILGFIYNADFLNINLRQFSLVKTFMWDLFGR